MSSEIMNELLQMIEAEVHCWPAPIEFEMAYQARVAIDRIRFAIEQTEKFAPRTDQMRELNFQLLDALARLDSAERNFQNRCRRERELRDRRIPKQRTDRNQTNHSNGGSI